MNQEDQKPSLYPMPSFMYFFFCAPVLVTFMVQFEVGAAGGQYYSTDDIISNDF